MPAVSIIICTRNRADSLRETLASINRCDIPADLPTELLVVDNGSTDHTRQVVEEAGMTNIAARHVFEPVPGLSRARNRGIGESTGDIILFTDDDVRVPEKWVEGMCRPISICEADAVAGGVVFPATIARMLAAAPLATRRGWFASTEELNPEQPQRLVGANMAFGRHVLSRLRGFDIELGAGALGFAEESLFSYRLVDVGYRIAGRLDVAIEHYFDTSRLTRHGILDSAERMGRSEGYLAWHWRQMTVQFCAAKIMRLRAELLRMRLLKFNRSGGTGFPSEPEIRAVQSLAFHEQFAVECRGPRKYRALEIPAPTKAEVACSHS